MSSKVHCVNIKEMLLLLSLFKGSLRENCASCQRQQHQGVAAAILHLLPSDQRPARLKGNIHYL